MKKEAAALLGLLGALAVCVGAYFGLRAWNRRDQTPPAITVFEAKDVTAIAFTAKDGQALEFVKEDGAWVYGADGSFPLDEGYVEAIVSALAPLEAQRVFEEPDALSAYGLDEGAVTVTVTQADGRSETVLVGNLYQGSYYAKTAGGEAVYTIGTALPDALDLSLLDMARLPGLMGGTEETITAVTVEQGGAAVRYTKTTETVTGEDGTDTQTYHWSRDGEPLDGADETLSALLDALRAPGFTACYDYKGSAESLEVCGLRDPARVTVTTGTGSETLLLGAAAESGSSYYAQLEGEPGIYTLAASLAQPLLAAGQTE